MSQPICKKQPMMLISPNETPATSRSASEGPLRKSASEPCQTILPIRRKSLELVAPPAREEGIDREVEKVPMSLARIVVNMQEHYTAELEAERQRTEELARQNEEMVRKMEEMEKRLQMHVVLMDGFVGFMRDVKDGKFATCGGAEMEIANAIGGEHLDVVRGLVAESYMPLQQSVEQPATEPMVFDEDEPHEAAPAVVRHVSFDESPSTPDLEAAAVRSTGRRAPKRKNPPLRPHREVKRQTRATLRSVRLRNTSSWTAINTSNSPYAGADLSNGEDKDLDFTPDPEVDEDDEEEDEEQEELVEDDDSDDEMEDIPNDPVIPSPSLSDEDLETTKTRYSAPRSVAYRYASGPPGRKFKYYRMPKSVALVWQEWKHGSNGNPSIQSLEEKYSTRWRMGTLQERKYASNYVGVRQKVVRKVEEMCEQKGLTPEKACGILDRRVDGRMQLLMTALRKGQDPLVVIPRR
ncbi:high-osmolarity-induced transcription factor [Fusarium sp. NRRL 52700]|nr:high-osmolarity-induced transcription factor [Fusarium sp. NRRL 52700]